MMLNIFFDISTGFRFSKISVECSVHLCSCPCLKQPFMQENSSKMIAFVRDCTNILQKNLSEKMQKKIKDGFSHFTQFLKQNTIILEQTFKQTSFAHIFFLNHGNIIPAQKTLAHSTFFFSLFQVQISSRRICPRKCKRR